MSNDSKNKPDCQTVALFAVYVIWCKQTDMHYVGVTHQRVEQRIRQHKKGKQFVDSEIKRIGWDGNWDWWVVEEGVSSELISEREQYWVDFFGSVYPNGYNKTTGGVGNFEHSEKTCEQISAALRGKKRAPFTAEHRAHLSVAMKGKTGAPAWNRGVPCTEETKDKIRQKLTGRKRPDQAERMRGENNPNFGKPKSEETREKLRQRALERNVSGARNPHYGKHHTEEAKVKIGEAHRGRTPWNKGLKCPPPTPEARAKMSAAQSGEKNHFYGKHHSEETKAKLREKALARHAAKEAAAKAAQETQETP